MSGCDKLSLLLPTRQRRSGLVRLAESIAATANDPGSIEMVVYVDDDDRSYDDLCLPVEWTMITGPRVHDDGLVNLSAKWNDCFDSCQGDILMHCGDDIVFRTPGWDAVVRQAFDAVPDKILFAFGRDGYQDGNNFGTHGFIHRKWVETVGFFVPPYFVSDYNDTFLNDVAKMIGRHREIPIYTEHMHFTAGKAEIDQNTQERLERHATHRPGALYHSPTVQRMILDSASKLGDAMDTKEAAHTVLHKRRAELTFRNDVVVKRFYDPQYLANELHFYRTLSFGHPRLLGHDDNSLIIERLTPVLATGLRPADELGKLLARLHKRGVSHRDVHIENIVIKNGQPLLIDWEAAIEQPGYDFFGPASGVPIPDIHTDIGNYTMWVASPHPSSIINQWGVDLRSYVKGER